MTTSSPSSLDATRRRFLAQFSSLGRAGTLLPGVLWAEVQPTGAQRITAEMLMSRAVAVDTGGGLARMASHVEFRHAQRLGLTP